MGDVYVLSLLLRLGQRFRCEHGPYYCRSFSGYPAAAPHGTASDEVRGIFVHSPSKVPFRIYLSRPARNCVWACTNERIKSEDGPSTRRSKNLMEFSSAWEIVSQDLTVRSLVLLLRDCFKYTHSGLFLYRKLELQLFGVYIYTKPSYSRKSLVPYRVGQARWILKHSCESAITAPTSQRETVTGVKQYVSWCMANKAQSSYTTSKL